MGVKKLVLVSMKKNLLDYYRDIKLLGAPSKRQLPPLTWAGAGFGTITTILTLTLLTGCDKRSTNPPDPDRSENWMIGKWADLANAPGTNPRVCCFFDSTREIPCAPDTLILRADGTMIFTSVVDEPSHYTVAGDTLYRFRGFDFEDTLRYGFSLSHDTLYFPITPLCTQNPPPVRFRKVP